MAAHLSQRHAAPLPNTIPRLTHSQTLTNTPPHTQSQSPHLARHPPWRRAQSLQSQLARLRAASPCPQTSADASVAVRAETTIRGTIHESAAATIPDPCTCAREFTKSVPSSTSMPYQHTPRPTECPQTTASERIRHNARGRRKSDLQIAVKTRTHTHARTYIRTHAYTHRGCLGQAPSTAQDGRAQRATVTESGRISFAHTTAAVPSCTASISQAEMHTASAPPRGAAVDAARRRERPHGKHGGSNTDTR